MASFGLLRLASDAPREAFALQEFQPTKPENAKAASGPGQFRPMGDSSLYESVMSLVKALKYEVDMLPTRHGGKRPVVFQFNLISLLDGSMYEGALHGAGVTLSPVGRYRHFAQTMIDSKSFSARVDFCTKAALPELLHDLTKLHTFNVAHLTSEVTTFYSDIQDHPQRLLALVPELEELLSADWWRYGLPQKIEAPGETSAWYWKAKETLSITMPYSSTALTSAFERMSESRDRLCEKVREIFRFTGIVVFESHEDAIPF